MVSFGRAQERSHFSLLTWRIKKSRETRSEQSAEFYSKWKCTWKRTYKAAHRGAPWRGEPELAAKSAHAIKASYVSGRESRTLFRPPNWLAWAVARGLNKDKEVDWIPPEEPISRWGSSDEPLPPGAGNGGKEWGKSAIIKMIIHVFTLGFSHVCRLVSRMITLSPTKRVSEKKGLTCLTLLSHSSW